MPSSDAANSILRFAINGEWHEVVDPDPGLLLVDYLRDPKRGLTGTKHSCGQGGCGSCAVTLSEVQDDGRIAHRSINACLRPVCALDGAHITTIEGLGNIRDGVSREQFEIAKCNGSQCGYCTPGFVMNLHSLRMQYASRTKAQIEQAFDGNICRCTGFRPILYAMSHFGSDWTPQDAHGTPECVLQDPPPLRSGDVRAPAPQPRAPASYARGGKNWYRPESIDAFDQLCRDIDPPNRAFVAGNTASGVPGLHQAAADNRIDLSLLQELRDKRLEDDWLILGASTTYTDLIELLEAHQRTVKSAGARRRLKALHYMAGRTAGTIVRNAATLAGNTMLVAQNASIGGTPFPSDLCTVLCGLDTDVVVRNAAENERLSLVNYLKRCSEDPTYSKDTLLLRYEVPLVAHKAEYTRVYKVALREVNAHSLVNLCIRLQIRAGKIAAMTLVFGALAPLPVRMRATEAFFVGRDWNKKTVTAGLDALQREISELQSGLPSWFLALPSTGISPEYQGACAVNLLRKACLRQGRIRKYRIYGPTEGVKDLHIRCVVQGSQHYAARSKDRQVGKPIVKLSAFEQATGEATYVHDLAISENGLHGAFVTATQANARFGFSHPVSGAVLSTTELRDYLRKRFSASFVDVIDSSDIPAGGRPGNGNPQPELDPWFAQGRCSAFGQSIALILAQTREQALHIAAAVTDECVSYTPIDAPILTIDEAIAQNSFFTDYAADPSSRLETEAFKDNQDWTSRTGKLTYKGLPCVVISGTQRTGLQNQFYMEPQSCIVTPVDGEGFTVLASSQAPKQIQGNIAKTLNIKSNKVQVSIKRLGGGYGGKTTRSPFVAVPTAIAANKWQVPVSLALPRDVDSGLIGNRHAFRGDYKLLVVRKGREKGRLLGFVCEQFSNAGNTTDCSFNVMDCAQLQLANSYNVPYFSSTGKICKTNLQSSTAMRSFGTIQSTLIGEDAIEAAANAIAMSAEALRAKNFYQLGDVTPYGQSLNYVLMQPVWERLQKTAKFSEREAQVARFNESHRFRKRGLCMIPIQYGLGYGLGLLMQSGALIDVYTDGSVGIHHNGVEMGQGIATKVVQIAADALNIPMSYIKSEDVDTGAVPNATITGATSSNELSGGAVIKTAKKLRRRLERFCNKLLNKHGAEWCVQQRINFWDYQAGWRTEIQGRTIWEHIVQLAYSHRINLSSQALFATPGLQNAQTQQFYGFTYSAACSEVEIDVLTGEFLVRRVDVLYDNGKSLNPAIDIGQIEGGFVMGMGNVTTELMQFEPAGENVGRLNTPNTWTYKPPASTTVPRVFNVDLFHRDPNSRIPHNPNLLLSSKGIGEPPLVLASTVFFAIKRAIRAARIDAGLGGDWFELESPATVERIQQACSGTSVSSKTAL